MILTADQAERIRNGERYLVVEGERESSFLSGEQWVAPDKWLIASRAERVELRVICPTCGGKGWHTASGMGPKPCVKCGLGGSVLFAHATIEVLPVVEGFGTIDDPLPKVCLHGERGVHLMRPFVFPSEVITLDPLPVPGRDWIVVLDNVELA